MSRVPFAIAAAIVAAVLLAAPASADHVVYKVRHRLAEDLAGIVRPLVEDVSVDTRTNTLILTGDSEQLRAANEILNARDVRLRTVRIRVRYVERERIETRKLTVHAEYAANGFWVATAPGDFARGGFSTEITADAKRFSSDRTTEPTILVSEGGEATITTGRSMPVNQWLVDHSEDDGERVQWRAQTQVETGFVVNPRVLADGTILLTIAPRASFLTDRGPKEIVYRRAKTTISIAPGESVIIAAGDGERGRLVSGMLSGFESEEARSRWAMALQADVVD